MIELIDKELRVFSYAPSDLSSEQQKQFQIATGIKDIKRLSFAYCPGLDCILINHDDSLFQDYSSFIMEYLKTSESVREELKKVVGPCMDSILDILDKVIEERGDISE